MGFKTRQKASTERALTQEEARARVSVLEIDMTDTPEFAEALGIHPWDIPDDVEILRVVAAPTEEILRAAGYTPYPRWSGGRPRAIVTDSSGSDAD